MSPPLVVRTRATGTIEDLLTIADPADPLAWLRRGDGIVGIGQALVLDVGVRDAAEVWRDAVATAEVDDPVGLPGSGLVAFGAFAFDPDSRDGRLVVPRMVVGRRGATTWVSRVGSGPLEPRIRPYGPWWAGSLGPGALGPVAYQDAVRRALALIDAGELAKVVVARDIRGSVPADADLRRLARALSTGYPDCWTYAVDGLIGASPETLVTVSAGTLSARVLAGTAARGADADADASAAASLVTSLKDLDEHGYAARSVVEALRPFASALAASEQPFTLRLPNVWHLATDVEGALDGSASALDLVAALHPTAAVAGAPREAALAAIRALEPAGRGRYAGPVGWVDARGDGEWAIALRGAQLGPRVEGQPVPLVAHAGAGIVAGSDPDAELMETRVKFRPIVDALA